MTQLTRVSMKEAIKNKFGFVSRFCSLAGLNLYETNQILDRGELSKVEKIYKLALKTEDMAIEGKELPSETKKIIIEKILQKYRLRKIFCEKYDYPNSYISMITDQTKRVRITPKLKKLCSKLQIKI